MGESSPRKTFGRSLSLGSSPGLREALLLRMRGGSRSDQVRLTSTTALLLIGSMQRNCGRSVQRFPAWARYVSAQTGGRVLLFMLNPILLDAWVGIAVFSAAPFLGYVRKYHNRERYN